jgi:tetratricopeptide (TPR) repeat protein
MSNPADRILHDVDPEPFIAEAQRRWEATADLARADFRRAIFGPPTVLSRSAIRLARILRGPGFADEATEVLREAFDHCVAGGIAHEPDALEALGDLARELGHKQEAITFYERAALEGDDAAVKLLVDLRLEISLPLAGPATLARVKQMPTRQQQVLALTVFATPPDSSPDYAYVGQIVRMSPEEVQEHETNGLEGLDPLRLPAPPTEQISLSDPFNIGGKLYLDSPDEGFADPAHLPGEVIGGTLTNDERAMIQLMDSKDRARYLLQKRIQEKTEMAVLLSQLQSLRHQTTMSVINNIR